MYNLMLRMEEFFSVALWQTQQDWLLNHFARKLVDRALWNEYLQDMIFWPFQFYLINTLNPCKTTVSEVKGGSVTGRLRASHWFLKVKLINYYEDP